MNMKKKIILISLIFIILVIVVLVGVFIYEPKCKSLNYSSMSDEELNQRLNEVQDECCECRIADELARRHDEPICDSCCAMICNEL